MSRRLVVVVVGAAVLAVLGWVVFGPTGGSAASFLRGGVRVWVVRYRTYDGRVRRVFVDLPAWYGPARHPLIPLVISAHGRQARAQANSALWGQLPAQGGFAVANPEGQGRVLQDESWGYQGQIADLARMPSLLDKALPWLRVDRRRVFAVAGSMGGQESLLLLARFPRLLAGVVVFDAPTDLAARYYALGGIRDGAYLQTLMRQEVGGTPSVSPDEYKVRSPIWFADKIAFSRVPVEFWWSRRDRVVVDQPTQSGRLYRLIRRLNPRAPVGQVVGNWPHMAAMTAYRALPRVLRWLGLLPAWRQAATEVAQSPASKSSMVCERTAPGSLGYAWPVKPFDRAHPVRANFGDPRTIFFGDLAAGGLDGPGAFSFHDGVDISAHVFTPVYPVVSGQASIHGDAVVVRAADDRRFEYQHLRIAVKNGADVSAGKTVLGYIQKPWRHVHLAEIDPISVRGVPDSGYQVVNPLSHLVPYVERAVPTVETVIARDLHGRRLRLSSLHGSIRLIAAAYALPAITVPGVWRNMPVAPAVLRWELIASNGKIALHWQTPVDFRRTIPPDSKFWRTYARGSYQNFPDVGERFYYRRPGRYLYIFTPSGIDTPTLANGRYILSVQAGDICGNTRTRHISIVIRNPPVSSSPRWQAKGDQAIDGSAGVVSRIGAGGRFVINGRPMFPIALAGPPPLGSHTPSGKDALNTVVSAGVNFFRVGPTIRQWKLADIRAVEDWDRAAAVRGVYTIVSLRRLSTTDPATGGSRLLEKIVTTLTRDASSRGIGLWRGADEPQPAGIPASDLRYAYCRVTSRGERRWCAGQPPLDRRHLWLTIQAPRGTLAQLAPYSAVTDSNGIDVYPVALHNPTPNLHQVGVWTHRLRSITSDHSVWTTLQICPNDSFDRQGQFVLPTSRQERYMIYDAIINGARGLSFFGGGNPYCWNRTDRRYRWSWAFWNHTLEPLLREISAHNPLAPALTNPASTRHLATNDPTTQTITRTSRTLWVIAARYGSGTKNVTITGLPPNIQNATVYTEHRRIRISNGRLTDRFNQWQVHIYELTVPTS
jgi:hypothetical protein